jgi:chemotaxis response regulator CheB
MPGAAIETGVVDFILPLTEIAPALISLVMQG